MLHKEIEGEERIAPRRCPWCRNCETTVDDICLNCGCDRKMERISDSNEDMEHIPCAAEEFIQAGLNIFRDVNVRFVESIVKSGRTVYTLRVDKKEKFRKLYYARRKMPHSCASFIHIAIDKGLIEVSN